RGWAALDYFVFPRGLFDPIPPFLIGRACFDNWLVWRAREREHPVVDATRAVVAVHQSHDYAHVPGGQEEAYYGEEARLNEDMAGGRAHIYSLHDATHRLYTRGRPVPYLLSIGRARERVRVAKASYDVRKRSETSVQKALRLLAVMPKPQELTTRLLNELAVRPDTSLTALYGERGSGPAPVGHVHWFPRSIRLPIKPDYPINWAIMNSFRGLAPHGMLVAGWDTFATQSAIAWCRAKGVPYLLVVDTVPPSQPTSVIARMFRRLAIAGASTVLTTSAATEDWLFAHGCDRSRVQRLLTAPDAAASALTQLLRDAPRTRQPRDVDTSTVRARRRLFVHRGS
ncbi:MAG TPA: hypothetical protein VFA30_05370, partial [Gaiellaceae bacterium]|nr:hypothetical protein [Gaiellaceae bacterium]